MLREANIPRIKMICGSFRFHSFVCHHHTLSRSIHPMVSATNMARVLTGVVAAACKVLNSNVNGQLLRVRHV